MRRLTKMDRITHGISSSYVDGEDQIGLTPLLVSDGDREFDLNVLLMEGEIGLPCRTILLIGPGHTPQFSRVCETHAQAAKLLKKMCSLETTTVKQLQSKFGLQWDC